MLFSSCATQSEPPPARTKSDLSGVAINHFNWFKGKLYAATDKGLYRKTKADTLWTSLGLQQKEVINVVFLPGEELLAAVRITFFSGGPPSLFLSTNNGRSWKSYMNNYGGETDVTWIGSITATSKPSDTLFAHLGVNIAKSINSGESWATMGGLQ